jgi:hypothetical protein
MARGTQNWDTQGTDFDILLDGALIIEYRR